MSGERRGEEEMSEGEKVKQQEEEEEVLEEFLFQFLGDEEEEGEVTTQQEEEEELGEEQGEGRRMVRAVSVWANDFTLSPVVFEGMPVREQSEPSSAIFRFIKKNSKEIQAIGAALDTVSVRDNAYRDLISIQRNVPYLENDDGLEKHKLDIYLPRGAGESLHNLPLVIHFHGGGWVRGDRKDEFRGAPTVCRQYSKNGIIAVTPSYRLVDCPGHMTDAVAAVKWTVKNLTKLGANPNKIFVSGHSAGGNIAANLVCGTWVESILEKYQVKIIGAVCMSGVYSLLNPLGGSYAGIKNKGFDKLYRLRVFGDDLQVLAKHSPVAQLRMMLGELPYPIEQCKLCNLAHAISQWICPSTRAKNNAKSSDADESDITSAVDDSNQLKSVDMLRSTSFLVMNASSDVGLETDGQRLVELLHRIKMSTPPQYHILPNLGHATITLDEGAISMASDFIHSTYQDDM